MGSQMPPQQMGSQMPNSTGSKRNLIIIIIIVVVLLILYVGSRMFWLSGGARGVIAPGSNDGSGTITTEKGTITDGTNELPSGWPSDVPTYSNGIIKYSGSGNGTGGNNGVMVIISSSDSVQTIAQYFQTNLQNKGWTISGTAQAGEGAVIGAKKDERSTVVQIAPDEGGSVISIFTSL